MKKTSTFLFELESILAQTSSYHHCWVAYSGGPDSTALLHTLKSQCDEIKIPLSAVHIDHKIHEKSMDWSKFCVEQCRHYGIEITCITVDASQHGNESPEAFARELRYKNIEKLMNPDDLLFVAHHMDDQAETLLLQLLRGAGPDGLAGMPLIRRFGHGWLVRPLLKNSKKELLEYNEQNDLRWITDSSNQDTNINRNFIRHTLLPVMSERWPSVNRILARSALHQSDYMEILNDVAAKDYSLYKTDKDTELNIDNIGMLPGARLRNLLRYWIRINAHAMASSVKLNQIIDEVINARIDATPCITWNGTEIRRFKNRIYILPSISGNDVTHSIEWNLDEVLELPHGYLEAEITNGSGIKACSINNRQLNIGYRKGGEKIQPAGRKETHCLKKLFQEAKVPPWERNKIPLLYIGDKLVAVPGFWIDHQYNAGENEPGWKIKFIAN